MGLKACTLSLAVLTAWLKLIIKRSQKLRNTSLWRLGTPSGVRHRAPNFCKQVWPIRDNPARAQKTWLTPPWAQLCAGCPGHIYHSTCPDPSGHELSFAFCCTKAAKAHGDVSLAINNPESLNGRLHASCCDLTRWCSGIRHRETLQQPTKLPLLLKSQ